MALPPSRIGEFHLHVDGSWDIDDLLNLSESLAESYGYFYALVVTDEEVARELHTLIQRQFWTGDLETRRFGKFLYQRVPKDDGLKIRSFVYHSPGTLTLAGILGVLLLTAKVVRAWIASGDAFLNLVIKIEKYFQKRKRFIKPKRQTALDEDAREGVEEARELVFETGVMMGMDELTCERIVAIAGNPISGLKLLVAVAKETRKLADMEKAGLLQLPPPIDQRVMVGLPRAIEQRPRVTVVRKPRRKKLKPPE